MDSITREKLARYHYHSTFPNQCTSIHVHHINSPLPTVWSLVLRFSTPQANKPFLTSCTILAGDGCRPRSFREVRVTSGLPAGSSLERLDELHHVMAVKVHEAAGRSGGAVVVESYLTDVPAGNTVDETYLFADTIERCTLRRLADVAEKTAANSTFNV